MLSSVFGCCYSERSKQLADDANTIKDAPIKGNVSGQSPRSPNSEDDDDIIRRVTFRRDGNTPREHYDGVPPESGDLQQSRPLSTSFPPPSSQLVRGFSFPERMLPHGSLPKPALVRRSSFTTDGKKDPNPAFAGKNVRFQLPGGVSDGSDSEETDTDEREAARQKQMGLQVREVGEDGNATAAAAATPAPAITVTTVSTNGLPSQPTASTYQTPAVSNDHEDEDLDVKVISPPATPQQEVPPANPEADSKPASYTPHNTLASPLTAAFQVGAIPPPNGIPRRDNDTLPFKTPAPSNVAGLSPPNTLSNQQAQALTAAANSATNGTSPSNGAGRKSDPQPPAPAPTPTAAETTNTASKQPPPLPDAPRPAEKKTVTKKPIPNPATPAKDAVRPNPWRFVSSGKLSDKYELTDVTLGSGAFGVVKVAHLISDENQLYAVKIIPKTNSLLTEEEFLEEVDIISKLHHPHIIALQDMYETDQNVYLVMELASGGELFDRLIEEKKIDEREAKQIAQQMFDAIAYLHSSGIIHRDLKPENILFKKPVKFSPIAITDFGFAKHLANNKQEMKARAKRGTMGYAAPEIFSNQPYDEKCDIWSAGVIVYIMLCGAPPFVELPPVEEGLRKPFWKLANPKKKTPDKDETVQFPIEYWAGVSENARSFLRLALEVNPLQRPRALDLLKHPWIKNQSKMNATQTFVASEPLPFMMQSAKHSMR